MHSSTPRWPDVETTELVVCTMVQTTPPRLLVLYLRYILTVPASAMYRHWQNSRRIMRQTVMLYG